MKFFCKCGYMINATVSPCSGLCCIYSQNEYIKFIDWIKYNLPLKLYPKYIRAYYCESCGSYYLEMENKYHILNPAKYEIESETYTALHIIDEIEEDQIFENVEEDKTIVPDTRMLYISYEDKRAYIVNTDETKETFTIEELEKKNKIGSQTVPVKS